MNELIIRVDHISKKFKNEVVLDDISVNFYNGHIYGIMGRNGSGKSVFFKILCGFMTADSGSVTVNGKIIGKDMDFPENIGVMIENPGFLWYQSGMANLQYLAGIRKNIGKKEVEDAIRIVGLDPKNKKLVAKYSLGMKQRLGIAQAIMENPEIIILDEPMNGLDDNGVKDMRRLFLDLKAKGKLLIIASHNKEDIDALCDEVYKIEKGHIAKMNSD